MFCVGSPQIDEACTEYEAKNALGDAVLPKKCLLELLTQKLLQLDNLEASGKLSVNLRHDRCTLFISSRTLVSLGFSPAAEMGCPGGRAEN